MAYYYYNGSNGSSNGGGFMSSIPRVTKYLILTNCFVYLLSLINGNAITQWFALFYPTSRYFHWWQLVTHMFVHGGFFHLFFNMYTLFVFGSVVEKIIGEKKFLLFYFVCGLGAAALHLGVQAIEAASYANGIALGSQAAIQGYAALKMVPTVGASGAIYGLLIAYAMLFPDSRLTLVFPPVSLSAKWMVLIFAAIELFTGVTGTAEGVAHFAHLGGMLFGALMILYWKHKNTLFDRENFNR